MAYRIVAPVLEPYVGSISVALDAFAAMFGVVVIFGRTPRQRDTAALAVCGLGAAVLGLFILYQLGRRFYTPKPSTVVLLFECMLMVVGYMWVARDPDARPTDELPEAERRRMDWIAGLVAVLAFAVTAYEKAP